MFKSLFDKLYTNTVKSSILIRNLNQYRTHYCNELSLNDVGKEVTVCGWLKTIRFNKFLIIKDSYDAVQVHIPEGQEININELALESVVKIKGTVRARPRGQENISFITGKIEIECTNIEIINKSKNLPFSVNEINRANEALRLKYRYLDLRSTTMSENIKFRSNFVAAVRNYLNENKFLDIETPTLFRRTPGGAREFLVPTRHDKKFYSLTQSPQQFKQLLMCAGFEKYYQIARCYRDEELKADRQPEFTQIDIEMSFINEDNCIELIEKLLEKCWPLKQKSESIKVPFRRMKFDDAMRFYGSDKPDLRFDMKFVQLNEFFVQNSNSTGISKIESFGQDLCAYAFKIPLNLYYDQKELLRYDKLEKILRDDLQNNELLKDFIFMIVDNLRDEKSGNRIVAKYMDKDFHAKLTNHLSMSSNEISVILLGKKDNEMNLLEILGKFRLNLADHIDNMNKTKPGLVKPTFLRDPNKFEFLWVVDFPLFTLNHDTKQYESTHHPFTAPKVEYMDSIMNNTCSLSDVKGQHYDLVLNGCEIAGGSIRIHNAKLQRAILTEILKEDTSLLEHLIEALEYGAPPHGGIAIGLDRLMSILCKTSSLRDVIAFPKSGSGRDLMSDAPSVVSKSDLDFYKIQLID
jgi:aspartyl-tRNA synthetase